LFDDYFIVSYREKTYLFKLKYDYMLSFEDKEFFDLSGEVNEFTKFQQERCSVFSQALSHYS